MDESKDLDSKKKTKKTGHCDAGLINRESTRSKITVIFMTPQRMTAALAFGLSEKVEHLKS